MRRSTAFGVQLLRPDQDHPALPGERLDAGRGAVLGVDARHAQIQGGAVPPQLALRDGLLGQGEWHVGPHPAPRLLGRIRHRARPEAAQVRTAGNPGYNSSSRGQQARAPRAAFSASATTSRPSKLHPSSQATPVPLINGARSYASSPTTILPTRPRRPSPTWPRRRLGRSSRPRTAIRWWARPRSHLELVETTQVPCLLACERSSPPGHTPTSHSTSTYDRGEWKTAQSKYNRRHQSSFIQQ